MIFIVDDNPSDIELAKIALSANGRKVSISTATDGESALAMLRSGRLLPSLVLLDLNMPGMGGIEMLREMRADNFLKDLPVVVVTSSSLESDKKDVIAAGANDFIRKHLSFERFRKDLEFVLRRLLPNFA